MIDIHPQHRTRRLPRFLTYEAVQDSIRRRPPHTGRLKSEDEELPAAKRRQLIGTTRDALHNSALLGWMIRRHLDYVATHTLQVRHADRGLVNDIEEAFRQWSAPHICDHHRRRSLHDIIVTAEARAVIDGDCFVVLQRDGTLRLLEAERVADPSDYTPSPPRQIRHGVILDAAGRPASYAVVAGHGLSGRRLVATIQARHVIHHAYWESTYRVDANRGVSPLAAALNQVRDLHEAEAYALAKAKIAQLIGFALKRDTNDPLTAHDMADDEEAQSSDPQTILDKVRMGEGPFLFDLDPADDVDMLESSTPPAAYQSYVEHVTELALKALDIPYSFYDESHTNFSGARNAWMLYNRACEQKRRRIRATLERIARWRLAMWIADGSIRLPSGVDTRDLKIELIPAGVPWIDPLKEVQAQAAAIRAGLNSRKRILAQNGVDRDEIAEELAEEAGMFPQSEGNA